MILQLIYSQLSFIFYVEDESLVKEESRLYLKDMIRIRGDELSFPEHL